MFTHFCDVSLSEGFHSFLPIKVKEKNMAQSNRKNIPDVAVEKAVILRPEPVGLVG